MYHDLIVRIKNAERAEKRSVRAPYSHADFSIAKILTDAGYLKQIKKKTIEKRNYIDIELFAKERPHAIRGVKFVSAPGRHVYAGYRDLKPVRQGYGLGILSTSHGIMTNVEARKQRVGGEYLFEIW
ncbi:MAG: 30S ribosomal protein S8 [Candidatus Liptonbacteria bacterium]|nr:30S ribosomal protein S8 [Candidatus Liptonbacteria bacterium]